MGKTAMNNATAQKLVAYMHNAEMLEDSDIERLFEIYAKNEIVRYSDLFRDHTTFHKLIESEMSNVKMPTLEDAHIFKLLARQKIRHFLALNSIYFKSYRHHQENWAKQIENLVGFDKDVRILEVGSGEIPYTSLIMARDGYNITSMGEFELPDECLERLHLKSYRGWFTQTTKVKDFDVVVGRRPCSAIEPMVTNCAKEKVPYMIRLCACELPRQDVYDWRWILTHRDRNIRFSQSYVYNMDNASFNPSMPVLEIIDMDEDKSRT
jgi:hypothetical protein